MKLLQYLKEKFIMLTWCTVKCEKCDVMHKFLVVTSLW